MWQWNINFLFNINMTQEKIWTYIKLWFWITNGRLNWAPKKVSSRFIVGINDHTNDILTQRLTKILSLPFASLERTFTNILHSRDILQEADEHCHITCHGILKQFTIELEKKENQNVCLQKKHLQEIAKIFLPRHCNERIIQKTTKTFSLFLQWSRVYLCIYFLISSFT